MRALSIAASLAALAALVAAPTPAWGQTGPDHLVRYSDRTMGTVVTLTIWGDDERAAAAAAQAVFAEFARIDALMTSWGTDSDVARLNAAGGKPVKVAPEVLALMQRSLEGARATSGAFDITVGSFRGLWKFDEDKDGSLPAEREIRRRLRAVGWQRVVVDEEAGTVRLRGKKTRITLGGVAKGYAVDRAVALLHERGILDFILQAGGDLYASGRRGDRSWRVGIRDPRGAPDASFALAEIQDATFSTSGDYERFVMQDGVRYHHILDPKTGMPARASRSVTVKAKDAVTADIWSTALFVLGPEEGMKLVEARPELEAVFVGPDNGVHVSSGLKKSLRLLRAPTDAP